VKKKGQGFHLQGFTDDSHRRVGLAQAFGLTPCFHMEGGATMIPVTRLPPKTERTGNVKIVTFTAGQEREH
jgi:hypothetical protein